MSAPVTSKARVRPRIGILQTDLHVEALNSSLATLDSLAVALKAEVLPVLEQVLDAGPLRQAVADVEILEIDLGHWSDPPDWAELRYVFAQKLRNALAPYVIWPGQGPGDDNLEAPTERESDPFTPPTAADLLRLSAAKARQIIASHIAQYPEHQERLYSSLFSTSTRRQRMYESWSAADIARLQDQLTSPSYLVQEEPEPHSSVIAILQRSLPFADGPDSGADALMVQQLEAHRFWLEDVQNHVSELLASFEGVSNDLEIDQKSALLAAAVVLPLLTNFLAQDSDHEGSQTLPDAPVRSTMLSSELDRDIETLLAVFGRTGISHAGLRALNRTNSVALNEAVQAHIPKQRRDRIWALLAPQSPASELDRDVQTILSVFNQPGKSHASLRALLAGSDYNAELFPRDKKSADQSNRHSAIRALWRANPTQLETHFEELDDNEQRKLLINLIPQGAAELRQKLKQVLGEEPQSTDQRLLLLRALLHGAAINFENLTSRASSDFKTIRSPDRADIERRLGSANVGYSRDSPRGNEPDWHQEFARIAKLSAKQRMRVLETTPFGLLADYLAIFLPNAAHHMIGMVGQHKDDVMRLQVGVAGFFNHLDPVQPLTRDQFVSASAETLRRLWNENSAGLEPFICTAAAEDIATLCDRLAPDGAERFRATLASFVASYADQPEKLRRLMRTLLDERPIDFSDLSGPSDGRSTAGSNLKNQSKRTRSKRASATPNDNRRRSEQSRSPDVVQKGDLAFWECLTDDPAITFHQLRAFAGRYHGQLGLLLQAISDATQDQLISVALAQLHPDARRYVRNNVDDKQGGKDAKTALLQDLLQGVAVNVITRTADAADQPTEAQAGRERRDRSSISGNSVVSLNNTIPTDVDNPRAQVTSRNKHRKALTLLVERLQKNPLSSGVQQAQAEVLSTLLDTIGSTNIITHRGHFELLWEALPERYRRVFDAKHGDLGGDDFTHTPPLPKSNIPTPKDFFLLEFSILSLSFPQSLAGSVAASLERLAPDTSERIDLARVLSTRLSYQVGGPRPALRHELAAAVDAVLTDIGTTAPASLSDQTAEPREDSKTPSSSAGPQDVITDHAGLVLLHPHLRLLFERLEILDADRQIIETRRDYAFSVLQGLTGSHGRPDALHYVLLGLEGRPELTQRPLNEETEALIEGLLAAVVAQWGRLGKTSPDGLRETFLVRPGSLTADDTGTHLHVLPGPFDMLLDGLPWPITPVALPWMRIPCHVHWRDRND